MDKICFTLLDGRRVCIPIFVQIIKFPPPGPDPERFGPRPWKNPFAVGGRLNPA